MYTPPPAARPCAPSLLLLFFCLSVCLFVDWHIATWNSTDFCSGVPSPEQQVASRICSHKHTHLRHASSCKTVYALFYRENWQTAECKGELEAGQAMCLEGAKEED